MLWVCIVDQLLSPVWLLEIPWTAACQAPLFSIISQSLLKFMSVKSGMLSNHLTLCQPLSSCLQSFPASGSFLMSAVCIRWPKYWNTASASVLPVNIQGWFSLRLTSLVSLQSKGLLRVFSSTTIWKHQFFGTQPSLWSNSYHIWLLGKNHSFDYMDVCWSDVSVC